MTDYGHTPYAAQARLHKAIRIEAALRMAGADADTARALDPKGRRDAERAAGTRVSSDETWDAVFTLMDAWRPHEVAPPAPTCPVDERTQGDPAVCHHCDGLVTRHVSDARAPSLRFCSEVCANAHLVGVP